MNEKQASVGHMGIAADGAKAIDTPYRQHPEGRLNDSGTYARAVSRGQPTFTLVAQDDSAPEVIVEWIQRNIRTAPRGKLFEALSRAVEFRDFERRKRAD